MHGSHLRLLFNVHHLHRISSGYQEIIRIQWGQIVCIRVWKCYVNLPPARWMDGDDHTSRSGTFAAIVQSYLPVSDHGEGCQSQHSESLWSQLLQSPWQGDCHCTSGQWSIHSWSSCGLKQIDWSRPQLPAGILYDWVSISAPCRWADDLVPPFGTHRSQGPQDLAYNRPCSGNDREVPLRELRQLQYSLEDHYSLNLPHHWATAASAVGHMLSIGYSQWRRLINAALHRQRHEAYRWVHVEVQVGRPWQILRMERS